MPAYANQKNLIGHRILVEPNPAQDKHCPGPREFILLEVSPGGKMVKMRRNPGNPFWCPFDEYLFIEDLGQP